MEAVLEAPAEAKVRARRGAPKKEGALKAQINVRIDAQLKEEADKAFASAGLNPSECVRAMYARAAELGSELRGMEDVVCLPPDEAEREELEEQARQMRAIERMSHIFEDVCAQYGFTIDVSKLKPMTEEEIEEAYYEDFLKECD